MGLRGQTQVFHVVRQAHEPSYWHAARASLPLQGLGKTSEPGARGGRAHGRSGPPGILFYFLSPTLSIGFRFSLGANRLGP